MRKFHVALFTIFILLFTVAPAFAAIDFGGDISAIILLLLIGVVGLVFAWGKNWINFGAKKGLDAVGLGSFYPAVKEVIEDIIIAVEVEAKRRLEATGVATTGEEKLEQAIDYFNKFTLKFGIDLDNAVVKSFIEGQFQKVSDGALAKVKEGLDKVQPPSV